MKYCAGVVDALFGRRIQLDLPTPGGITRKVKVTERWLAGFQRRSTVQPVEGSTVIAHIIDPCALARAMSGPVDSSALWFARVWTIGRDLSVQEYERWRDPETGGLYSYLRVQNGTDTMLFVERRRWEALRSMLKRFDPL